MTDPEYGRFHRGGIVGRGPAVPGTLKRFEEYARVTREVESAGHPREDASHCPNTVTPNPALHSRSGGNPIDLITDIARTGWRNLCWLIRTTRKNLRDNR